MRLRGIHPSAALFIGVLIAFTLPFGYSAQACGPQTEPYRGGDLLVGDVEADGDEAYAEGVAFRGLFFGWLLFASAALGLRAAVRRAGRWWASWCALTAFLALTLGICVIEAGEPDVGWLLALFIPTGGVVLKILIALVRWIARLFAPSVTTPEEAAVR